MQLPEYIDKKSIVSALIGAGITLIIGLIGLGSKGFLIYYGDKSVEIRDICIDSLENNELLSKGVFIPKKPKYLAIHTTNTLPNVRGMDLWDIFRTRWGVDTKPGYHQAIYPNGFIYTFVDIDGSPYLEYNETVNGVRGHNSETISIAYVGGRYRNDITYNQLKSIRILIDYYKKKFPQIKVTTHRELASKDINGNGKIDSNERIKECPLFDIKDYPQLTQ